MSTPHERRVQRLEERLKARTKADGKPRPGYEQNVAAIRAELDLLNERIAKGTANG